MYFMGVWNLFWVLVYKRREVWLGDSCCVFGILKRVFFCGDVDRVE